MVVSEDFVNELSTELMSHLRCHSTKIIFTQQCCRQGGRIIEEDFEIPYVIGCWDMQISRAFRDAGGCFSSYCCREPDRTFPQLVVRFVTMQDVIEICAGNFCTGVNLSSDTMLEIGRSGNRVWWDQELHIVGIN